tara:strand:+ start:238 stop:528 length:291 start_codon:yes stop_codon:yes gene_type:complete
MRKARGMEETSISSSAAAAAWAKNASEVAAQVEVARVVKPTGLRISVAGNSFMVSKKTKAAPEMMPGLTRGIVTDEKTRSGDRPRLRAASSMWGLI